MAFCSKCGEELVIGAAFCGGCGDAVSAPGGAGKNRAEFQVTAPTNADDDHRKLFVGKNQSYFARKWAIGERRGSGISWNWAAFFLGISWTAYRKMYMYSWIILGLSVVTMLAEYAFELPEKLSTALSMGIAVTFGWQGNNWYKIHVDRKVREIMAMHSPEQARVELVTQGGTNSAAAIGFIVAWLAVTALVFFVAER